MCEADLSTTPCELRQCQPAPGRFLHFFWLSLSLSGSLGACFFYIRSVDEERNLSFPFFLVWSELALVCIFCEIQKVCW